MKPVTDNTFNEEVRNHDGPVLVMVKAAWCNPCKEFEPIVKTLENRTKHVKFVTIDIDEANEREGETSTVVDDFNIRTFPSLVLFNQGMLLDVLSGRHPISEVRMWIDETLN